MTELSMGKVAKVGMELKSTETTVDREIFTTRNFFATCLDAEIKRTKGFQRSAISVCTYGYLCEYCIKVASYI